VPLEAWIELIHLSYFHKRKLGFVCGTLYPSSSATRRRERAKPMLKGSFPYFVNVQELISTLVGIPSF